LLKILPPPIAKPPWSKLGKKLESAVRKAIYDFNLLEDQSEIAIALSGGKDSLTLLYLLHAISRGGFAPFKLTALHVTGAFSCGANLENTLLKGICQELNIELHSLKAEQTLKNLECYSCSRERRSLIFKAANRLKIKTIAFGHHRDDHAQTILMNLFHKGEFAGMLPKIKMVNYGITIIRPLIYVDEAQIKEFAAKYKFARITCQCPVGKNSMRKQTDQLLTQLEALYPNVRANVSRAALLYGSDKSQKVNCEKRENGAS